MKDAFGIDFKIDEKRVRNQQKIMTTLFKT